MDIPPGPDAAPRRRKVLIVDDDPIMREVMREQLADIGCDSVLADNGETGRDAASEEPFDLAVVDISMPRLNGFELLRYMRQHPRTVDLPVIVCTSHNNRESIDKAYDLGASSFVTKPINWPQFAHHVQFVMRNGETERALRAARAEALTASRMKNGLFHVLSHELKTPLTALIGLTGVLKDSLASKVSAAQGEQLDLVIDGAQRLNGIVSDILILSKALSSPDQKNYTAIAAQELLDDALSGHKNAARERDVTLIVRPLESQFTITCDAHLIRQAFARLISNAVKFSPPKGAVEIWAHRRADGSALISVRDQGPGLSAGKLQECLKPFLQEDMSYSRPADGLGLGLPIAKTICEAHGGELAIQSAPGKGMLAAICLPPKLVTAEGKAA